MLTALASMEGHAQIKSMATPVPAALASPAPTVSMKSMSVTPSPASTGAPVIMPSSPSVAPVQKATQAAAARYIHLRTLRFVTFMFWVKQ